MAKALEVVSDITALINSAVKALSGATTSAEILDAREKAGMAYDAAKRAHRFAKATKAHNDILERVRYSTGEALKIEIAAKIRLAEEYDAAQERGEVAGHGGGKSNLGKPKVKDIDGLSYDQIHEARKLAAAEKADPGITQRAIKDQLDNKQEPTRAQVQDAIAAALAKGSSGKSRESNRNPVYKKPTEESVALSHLLYTCCVGITETFNDFSPEVLVKCFNDKEDVESGLEIIRSARAVLGVFEKHLRS